VTTIDAETAPFTLERVLDPIEPAFFLDRHWETAPLLIERADPDHFAGLPGLDAVDALIAATASNRLLPNGVDRLVRSEPDGELSSQAIPVNDNAIPDIQAVYRAYADGFTVIVNEAHRRSVAIGRLCRGLQSALHHPVGANLYLTPAGGQGFRPHVDTHDVFILQLHGEKVWHVGDPTAELPLADDRHNGREPPLAQTYRLSPGDTFYLPRGFPHEAVATDSSSLHLTVGIHTYRWADLIGTALGALAAEDVAFRGALSPGFLDAPLDSERAAELARRLAVALGDGALTELAKRQLGDRLVGQDAAPERGRFRNLDALGELAVGSVVARPAGLLCQVRGGEDKAEIEFAGNFVAGPAKVRQALEFVALREQFTVGELPGDLTSEDRIDLASRLVSEGLLEVVAA
jgi:bifunctional lysine-specific demethylase and histidyl-hydroxylase NO66